MAFFSSSSSNFPFKSFKRVKALLTLSGIWLNDSVTSNFTQYFYNQKKDCFQTLKNVFVLLRHIYDLNVLNR